MRSKQAKEAETSVQDHLFPEKKKFKKKERKKENFLFWETKVQTRTASS